MPASLFVVLFVRVFLLLDLAVGPPTSGRLLAVAAWKGSRGGRSPGPEAARGAQPKASTERVRTYPLDAWKGAHAPGIAGGCRPQAVKHPPEVPRGERVFCLQ